MVKSGDYIEGVSTQKSLRSTGFKDTFLKNASTFLKIDDELGGEEIRIDELKALLTSEDIDSEIDKMAVAYALMSNLYAFSEERLENEKLNLKKLMKKLQSEAEEDETMGRVTDTKIKLWIEGDIRYRKQMRKINKYQRQVTIFKQAYLAFDLRSRMLQTKSANNRQMNNYADPSDRADDHAEKIITINRKKKKE